MTIRDLRLERGASQRELARALGISQSTLSRIERGALALRWVHVVRLARWLGRSVSIVADRLASSR